MKLCRVITVILIGLVIGGCALRIDESRLAADLEPVLQPASEAGTAAGGFRIERERWPLDVAELQAFATEHDLPFRAEVFQQLDMQPQPDGSLLMNFELRESGSGREGTVEAHGTVRISLTGIAEHCADSITSRVSLCAKRSSAAR